MLWRCPLAWHSISLHVKPHCPTAYLNADLLKCNSKAFSKCKLCLSNNVIIPNKQLHSIMKNTDDEIIFWHSHASKKLISSMY